MKDSAGYFEGKKTFYSAVIFFLIIFSGCATKEAIRNIPDEEVLRERVMAYWGYKIKQEFDKSYAFEDPFYKGKVNLIKHLKGMDTAKASWTDATVESLKINGDSAIVDMKVKIRIIVAPSARLEQEVPLKEMWVKVDGIWYHVPKKSGIPGVVN